ncbi:sulfatase/phosphatase domain-containing protein [Sulfuriroseicoccus oceanibius]|uniref:Sulfatase-like hydrolase/transferase n=1 Tax=Sulfuriroseicoccus oceanibius TaxID=2707525 RepID=A0A6B3LF88_9BACT|nr:sulfatase/phosphatase domain-containing protein [Sulfuriroseicoccus oceanibius]QQL45870.1 sulfatase-like hydrolase/transferase [Sulfuriroseicoccus oceanibius]
MNLNRNLPSAPKRIPRTLGLFAALTLSAATARASAPNIVVFFSDDHTQQGISAYHNVTNATVQDLVFKDSPLAQTPNIDRLADQGAVFTHSYVSNSICQPSRANLITGLHSHANGHLANTGGFNGAQQTLPKLLQSAGYSTALIGKWHLGTTPTGFDHFEYLVGQGEYYSPRLITSLPSGGSTTITHSGEYIADVLTNRTQAWLQNRLDTNQTNPFFIMVNHKGTHRVWNPAPAEIDPAAFRQVEWDYSVTPNPTTAPEDPASWTPALVPVPSNFSDYRNGYPTRATSAAAQEMEISAIMRLNEDLKLDGSTFGGTAYDEVRTWWNANRNSLTQDEKDAYFHQRYIKDYLLTAKSVDRSVGDILDFLEANQLDRNTIVIYASDQGFYLGEHGWFDKRWMYEESLRTPLLMQWKDASGNSLITPGTEVNEMVQVIDYAPTLLEAAGVTQYDAMHGESFLGWATAATNDQPAAWRDSIYYHYYEGYTAEHRVGRHYGIRTDRYKLIFQYERANQWELFDLLLDPYEMNNLLYNAETGTIDNPTDGVDGTPQFQALVIDLMTKLRSLRTLYGDTSGTGFSIPGVDLPDPDLLTSLQPDSAAYEGDTTDRTTAQPVLENGVTLEINCTPASSDLTGMALLIEIGGNSNGSALYLVDGVPTFIQKQNSSDPATPTSLADTTLPEIAVQSSYGTLTSGITYQIAAIYTPPAQGSTTGTLRLAVKTEGGNTSLDVFSITNASPSGNWSGNETLSVGTTNSELTNRAGLSTTPGTFYNASQKSFSGTIERALYWNATGSITSKMKVNGSGHSGTSFSVDVSDLVKGATYTLYRCTDLSFDESTVAVDSAVAGDGPLVLTDPGTPSPIPTTRAFYKIEEN